MSPEAAIFLVVLLFIILALIIVIIVVSRIHSARPVGASVYRLYPGIDGTALNNCQETRNQPCVFPVSTLSDAVDQCDLLHCDMFSYNGTTQSMKFINPSTTFVNRLANSYRVTDFPDG
jgi:hypothetical protein